MLEIATKLLLENQLCDYCLGRQFALLGYGLSNKERGNIIKNAIVMELYEKLSEKKENLITIQNIAKFGNSVALKALEKKGYDIKQYENEKINCSLCQGLFSDLNGHINAIYEKIKNENFNSFLIGAVLPPILVENEDMLRAKYQISAGESIKSDFTREVGKKLSDLIEKDVDFELPDITIIINMIEKQIFIQKRSVYIYGRYKKFIRTIPQTKWICWQCGGKGCTICNFTGKRYLESIQELIAEPILQATKGIDSKFHGAGREDIDALMLGNGRPFVVEIINPQKRVINLKKIERKINKKAKKKIQVSNLSYSDKRKVQELKNFACKTQKTYKAKIKVDRMISEKEIKRLEKEFAGIQIKQKTPNRVLHRRSDLERIKMVYEVQLNKLSDFDFEAIITGEGGLYIKELISGDEGRTNPSFSSKLNCNAKCVQLDVIYLHSKE